MITIALHWRAIAFNAGLLYVDLPIIPGLYDRTVLKGMNVGNTDFSLYFYAPPAHSGINDRLSKEDYGYEH